MIGLDATYVRADRLTGIERHIVELVLRAIQLSPADTFILFCRAETAGLFGRVEGRAQIRTCPWKLRPLVDQLWLPAAVARSGVALVHYMTLAPPVVPAVPFLLTIHDLTYWKLPFAVPTGGRIYYRPLLERALRSPLLQGVVTVSGSAEREIRDFVGHVTPVWTVPNAPAAQFRPVRQEAQQEVLARYRIQRPYVFTVGTLEPRKNLSGLLRAFAALRRRIPKPLWLVVAGRRGWDRQLSIPAEVAPHVRFLGVVPDCDLPALYSGAALFVSTSLYEGFGLPLIEAMACGTLGVVSDLPVFREVGGAACLYADPADPERFADEMARGLELAELDQARERALRQAGRFTWEASAMQLLRIYQRVLDSRVSRDDRRA